MIAILSLIAFALAAAADARSTDPSFWFIPLFYAVVRGVVARKNWRMRAH